MSLEGALRISPDKIPQRLNEFSRDTPIVTAAALGLVGEGALAASAYHGGLDAFALHTPLLLLGGLPLALLVLAAPPPRRLAFRVVTWGIAALFVIGSVGVVSASQSSGLEGAWFLGLLLFTVWVAVTSVRWLREQPE